eukprot:TRINITY_DN2680_c0_g1_i1.p1 TRINITY_DN2680_c0_g1~~TRINITY_DN2680_c0_g1_i1.p1  ORF type:complete len:301 (-),score=58.61 TRINITY_DN2680_c0_g1_i1:38-940(-)
MTEKEHCLSALNLTYFNCRGRGHVLRLMLYDSCTTTYINSKPAVCGGDLAGVKFTETVVEVMCNDPEKWPSMVKENHEESVGLFASLPVLNCTYSSSGPGFTVSQLLAVGTFLGQTLLYYPWGEEETGKNGLSSRKPRAATAEEIARVEMFSSAAYLDLINPLIDTVWQPIRLPNENSEKMIDTFFKKVSKIFIRLESYLRKQNDSHYLFGRCASPADFFVFEAVDMVCFAMDGNTEGFLLKKGFEQLSNFIQHMKKRENLSNYLLSDITFKRLSGCGREGEMVGLARKLSVESFPSFSV